MGIKGKDEKQAKRLWLILTGRDPAWQYYDEDEVAEELAQFGESAAAIILRDVRAAVEFANCDFDDEDDESDRDSLIAELEAGGDGADEYGYSDLSWRHPWLDEDRLGGMANVFRIRMVLKEIGGPVAQRAISLLSLVEDDAEAVDPKDIPALAAVLSGADAESAVTAVHALGRIGPDAVDPLLAVFSPAVSVSDEKVERGQAYQTVRSAAARALGRIGDRRALDALVAAIGTYDRWTSEAAIHAVVTLGGIGDRRALDALVAAIGTYGPWTSKAAIHAVVTLGGDPRAVVPTLKAKLLKDVGSAVWGHWDRIEVVARMGPRTFEALIDATSDADPLTRSLALRALAEIMKTEPGGAPDGGEATQRREQAAARAAAELGHPSPSIRFSAIELLRRLDLPGLSDLLVPLLDDRSVDEYGVDDEDDDYHRTVGQAAADALPDDDVSIESLRQALADGRLDATRAWESFVDQNDSNEQIRGTARHGEVLAPYVLEAAKRADYDAESNKNADVFYALGWVATTEALERLGQGYLDDAEEILRAKQIWRDKEYEPEALKRMPLRWQYRVGDEFRGADGDYWKIVRRIPETDDWRTLVFDIAKAGSRSVWHHQMQCWWDMGVVAALTPVETGTFESALRTWEAEWAMEKKIASLKARHGVAPRPVPSPRTRRFSSSPTPLASPSPRPRSTWR